jgi:hypothetical protein
MGGLEAHCSSAAIQIASRRSFPACAPHTRGNDGPHPRRIARCASALRIELLHPIRWPGFAPDWTCDRGALLRHGDRRGGLWLRCTARPRCQRRAARFGSGTEWIPRAARFADPARGARCFDPPRSSNPLGHARLFARTRRQSARVYELPPRCRHSSRVRSVGRRVRELPAIQRAGGAGVPDRGPRQRMPAAEPQRRAARDGQPRHDRYRRVHELRVERGPGRRARAMAWIPSAQAPGG